jgi:nicotinate-nucleotide--dimethylbenzimidazole phosphoribosyltransferase
MTLEEYIAKIQPLDENAVKGAWEYWDSRCKPLRGMGRLEEMVVQLAGIYGTVHPRLEKPVVVIMGADNGVVAEGVSQTGSEVTAQVLENMGNRISSVCIMARSEGIEVIPVNIGMFVDGEHPRIRNKVVRYGTGNISKEPAMTREEAIRAIITGIETVQELYEEGYRMIITGEMGIGNTTPSSAMASVLLSQEVEKMTGRGAGLSSAGLERKIQAIKRAIEVNQPDKNDVLDVLSKVGSLDIAGMIGCFMGAAICRVPALIDGFISSIAAYCAACLAPACKPYMVATHCSAEPAGRMMLEALGMEAPIQAGMHLGEGTGAVTAYGLYKYAFALYDGLPGWNDGKVEAYEHLT